MTRTANTQSQASTWTSKLIAEKQVGSKNWKAQALISPEGEKYLSLKGFAQKQDGTEYQTKQGITLPLAECTPENLAEIAEVMKALYDFAVKGSKKASKTKMRDAVIARLNEVKEEKRAAAKKIKVKAEAEVVPSKRKAKKVAKEEVSTRGGDKTVALAPKSHATTSVREDSARGQILAYVRENGPRLTVAEIEEALPELAPIYNQVRGLIKFGHLKAI